MKLQRLNLPGILFLLAFLGCGGGNGALRNASTTTAGHGRATFTIQWPVRSRLIPDASNSIVVAIKQGTTVINQQTLPRPSGGGASTVTFDPLPTGTLSATATAYPNTNGIGTAQATATIPLTIQANQTTSFTLTMSSTINHLELTSPQLSLAVGNSLQMTVTAKDAGGAVVLLSAAKLQWKSSNTAAAVVDTSGKVTGAGVGNTDISVTDSETGKTAKVTLHVKLIAPIAFQSPAPYTIPEPNQLVAADFDGDGKMDVAVGSKADVEIFYGKGDGTFEAPRIVTTWSAAISPFSAGDMNGDGKPDLVCTVPGQFLVIHNQGGRNFAAPIAVALNTELGPLVTRDFNGDGLLDVAIIAHDHPGSTSTDIFIFQNQGGGNYTQVATLNNIWIILTINAGDLNGDGKMDLLVAITTDIVGTSGAGIYWGDGTGNFSVGPGANTATLNVDTTVIADFNGDGKLDYAIANNVDGSLSVVLNAGNGTFNTPATYGPLFYPDALAAADLDGDGKPDIAVDNRDATYFTVMRNQNALFPNQVQFPIAGHCGPLTTADLNGDGKPDVIVSCPADNQISVSLNSTP